MAERCLADEGEEAEVAGENAATVGCSEEEDEALLLSPGLRRDESEMEVIQGVSGRH